MHARAPTSLGIRRDRFPWIPRSLSGSFVAAGTATALWFGFLGVSFAPAAGEQPSHIERPTTIIGHQWVQFDETRGSPEHVELVVQDQKGAVGTPIPLGISVRGGSANEIVVLEGLREGMQISLGTSLSSKRWSLSVRELDQAFVAPPKDFRGSMALTAKLYSARNELLQTATIHFRWS